MYPLRLAESFRVFTFSEMVYHRMLLGHCNVLEAVGISLEVEVLGVLMKRCGVATLGVEVEGKLVEDAL